MAKKRSHAKSKYKSFYIHGHYPMKTIFLYVAVDVVISCVLGLILQSQITQALASF
jgi:hypothetical protein